MSFPKTIRALTFGKPLGSPHFTAVPLESPLKKGHILVKIRAAALNPLDFKLSYLYPLTFIPIEKPIGNDFAGEVVAIAEGGYEGPEDVKVGDLIYGLRLSLLKRSTVADYFVLDPSIDVFAKVPANLSVAEAAGVPCVFITAYNTLEAAKHLTGNSKILILGGGTSVGMASIQLAFLQYGITDIVVTCSEHSAALSKKLGAKQTVPYNDKAAMLTALEGAGPFDLIIDTVGGHDVLDHSGKLLSKVHLFASVTGDVSPDSKTMDITSFYFIPKMIFRMLFGSFYGLSYKVTAAARSPAALNQISQWFEEKKLTLAVDSVIDWNDWKQGWDKLLSRKVKGKIILTVSE